MENRIAGLTATVIAFPLFLALSLASAAAPSAAPPEAPPASAAPSPAPSAAALQGNELNILYTTNIIGEIDPCGWVGIKLGGLARRASFIQSKKAEGPCILVDTGDHFFRDLSLVGFETHQLKKKSEILADASKALGFDVVVPGESDFATGLAGYRELVKRAGMTPVCANLMLGKDRVFEASVVRELNGLKIGFIGVFTTMRPLPQENNLPLVLTDATTAVAEARKALEGKVDYVVLLSHMGFDQEKELAGKVPGIDIIIGGHSRESLGIGSVYGQTAIFQSGQQGKYIGQITLKKGERGADGKLPVERTGQLHEMSPARPDDPQWAKVVKDYHEWVDKENQKRRASETPPGGVSSMVSDDVYWGAELCGQCHQKQSDFWKKTVHSHAYETLVKAKKQNDVECLSCHTTAFAQTRSKPGLKSLIDVTGLESVQCESCHAPGSRHNTPEIRQKASVKDTCTRCHDPKNSPKFDHPTWLPRMRCPSGS